jgi:hypothetical protein
MHLFPISLPFSPFFLTVEPVMAYRRLLLFFLLTLGAAFCSAQQEQRIPDMSFEVGMTTQGMPGVYHYLQFLSSEGNSELIEITISELLFNVEKFSTHEGTIQVSRGFAEGEYVIKYLSPMNAAKFFVFTYDAEHHLKSIKGSATSIEKMPGYEESKVSVDTYVEMRSDERHYIPVTLKTILPGVYPWNTKLPK